MGRAVVATNDRSFWLEYFLYGKPDPESVCVLSVVLDTTLDWIGSSSAPNWVGLVFGEFVRTAAAVRAVGPGAVETAVPMGGVAVPVPVDWRLSSESSDASSSTTMGGGIGCELLCEEELLLPELLELDDDEEVGRARVPPNCMGGIDGTGGMPAALSEALLLLLEPPPALVGLLLEGDCLGDEDRPACLYDEFDMFRAWPG